MEFNREIKFACSCSKWRNRIKGLLIGIFFLAAYQEGTAQFVSSVNAMIGQISALEAYKQLLSDGYKIETTGVNAIKTIKGAEFSLHTTFFSSLKAVNPQVSGYVNQTGVMTTLQRLSSELDGFSSMITASPFLAAAEKQELLGLVSSYQGLAQEDASMINSLLSAGETSMTDGERIGRLDPLIKGVNGQFRSLESLIDQTSSLASRRANEQHDNQVLQSLY